MAGKNPSQGDVNPRALSLGSLILLGYYNSYSTEYLDHYCTGQWYLLVLEQLQRAGVVDRAEAWFASDTSREFMRHGVTVRAFRSFTEMARAAAETAPDVLWVRGKCPNYLPVLRRAPARLRVFYSASKRFIAPEWNDFDLYLVDDARHVAPVERLVGAGHVARVIKTADTAIFRPLGGAAKQFDVCVIGDTQTDRKNFDAVLDTFRSDPSLSGIFVGRQEPHFVDQLRATGARLTFREFCSRDELNDVMNQSRVGLVAATMDAAPRVIMEFMAAGTPVVMNSAILGGRDYITPETGLLADESEFAAAIRRITRGDLLLDPRRGFERHFAPAVAAAHLGSVLCDAMHRFGRAAPTPPQTGLRQLIRRPFFLSHRLARCWREIDATRRDAF